MAADACRATLHSGLAQFRAEYGPSACAVPFVDHVLAGHDNTTYGHVWSPIYSFFTRFVQHPAAVLSDRASAARGGGIRRWRARGSGGRVARRRIAARVGKRVKVARQKSALA